MKIATLVLALITLPESHAMDDRLHPTYAVAAISELQTKVIIFLGCTLVGAMLGAVLALRINKKRRALRELIFSITVLAGSSVGMLIYLGKSPW